MSEKKKETSLAKLNRIIKGDVGTNPLSFSYDSGIEHNVALQGSQGSLNYMKMANDDAQIGMILNIYKNPIKSASWCFEKPKDISPQEELAINILDSWYFRNNKNSFGDLLSKILSMIEYGFSCFELIWTTYTYEGNLYYVPVLEQRIQTSIDRIEVDKGVVQQHTRDNGLVPIPLEDMVFFTLNKQGNDLRGKSILRHCYQNWVDKNRYRIFQGIGIQRSQTGIPSMEVPETTSIDDADYIACETLLKNITTHENAYMITKKGFVFDIKSFKNDPEKIQLIIDKLDEKNAISVLAQFILLGTGGGGGAYALSRDQSDMFLDGLNYIVNYIEERFNSEIVSKFIEYNFGNTVNTDNVKLKGLNLNKKAGSELADTLTKLNQSGFIKATLDDEIQMRRFLELPDLSEDEIERRQERRDNPPIPPNPIPEIPEKNKVKLSEGNRKDRIRTIDIEQKQLKDVMRANLILIKDKLVADINNTLNKGKVEIKGLKAIEVSYSKYAKSLERKLAGIANLGWNQAKSKAKKNKVKLSDPVEVSQIVDKVLAEYVKNEAQLIAEDQVVSMKIQAIATATSSNLKGYSNAQTISNIEKSIDAFLESQKIQVGASLMVVGGLNFGEQQFYKEISDEIWGYRFVAVDDGNTSEICLWYKDKTFSINSSESNIANPPLHPNCRSYLEPIYKSEMQDKPKIDDVVAPPSVMKGKTVY